MDILQKLQNWYASHCNGEWEHGYGIKIETCDNPGWLVQIDLAGTELAARSFQPLSESVDHAGVQLSDRWLHCMINDCVWHGAGDETKLPVIIEAFLAWAQSGIE
jgi:hypothetical protein